MAQTTPPPHPRQSLPESTQRTIAGSLAAAAIAALLAALWLVQRYAIHRNAGEALPEPARGTFRPTPGQWAGIQTDRVREISFPSQVSTDGKIAFDDDTTTPVYSPFSGRVTRLMAKAGDLVEKGSPLFEIAASEFAQAENDLVAGGAALKTARAQLKLAQTSEQRQHALFQANGGALKDWQQSQVDLANAEGGLRSAEVALGAVRNRLRILGRSEAEISQLESSPDPVGMPRKVTLIAPVTGVVTQRQVALGQNITKVSRPELPARYTRLPIPRSPCGCSPTFGEADAPLMRVRPSRGARGGVSRSGLQGQSRFMLKGS